MLYKSLLQAARCKYGHITQKEKAGSQSGNEDEFDRHVCFWKSVNKKSIRTSGQHDVRENMRQGNEERKYAE